MEKRFNFKYDFKIAGNTAVIALCVIGATIVAATGHDGWGWLLFLAFLVFVVS